MLDVGSSELLLIVIVAIVVIGPKDLPRVLYKLGQVIGKGRAMTRHFRAGIDEMIRQAEMEEMEKKWAADNARIMAQTGEAPVTNPATDPATDPATGHGEMMPTALPAPDESETAHHFQAEPAPAPAATPAPVSAPVVQEAAAFQVDPAQGEAAEQPPRPAKGQDDSAT